MDREQPRVSIVDVRPGDKFKTPYGNINIENVRNKDDLSSDTEYYIKDPRTGEEGWFDEDFLLLLMKANLNTANAD